MISAARPKDLPDFERPPVTEVVLSIQFAPLPKFTSAHVGLFWDKIRKQYPTVAEHPPVQTTFETFGTPTPSKQNWITFESLTGPPMPRFWFEVEGQPDLLQIQHDRMMQNWRQRETEPEYPRYETIKEKLVANVSAFSEFLEREDLGSIRPNQCEVTYINTLELPGGNAQKDIGQLTPLWSGRLSEEIPARLENVTTDMRYVFGENDPPDGRIYVKFQPAVRNKDLVPVSRLELTARGKPADETIEAAFNLLDRERQMIVKAFAAVTNPEMHKVWGRK